MTIAQGFYVGPKVWSLVPDSRYEENPPDTWEDCEQCGCVHPPNFTGDCRDDINRWPSSKCVAALVGKAAHRSKLISMLRGYDETDN